MQVQKFLNIHVVSSEKNKTRGITLHFLFKHVVKLLSSKQNGVSVQTDTETNGTEQPRNKPTYL